MAAPTQTARDIVGLLETRHSKDVFVSECKDGPTWTAQHLRLDAWAMRKSWTKPWTYGYEIKVRRSDFLADDKWPGYLELCNYFLFVCPPHVIEPHEVGEHIGLLWVSSTGTRLYTKRKPNLREVQIPEDLFRYILMSRAKIVRDTRINESRRDYWERWLRDKKENQSLGWLVSQRIQKIVQAEIDARRIAEAKVGAYKKVEAILEELGFDTDTPHVRYGFENEVRRAMGRDPRLAQDLRAIAERIGDAADRVESALKVGVGQSRPRPAA
jgi:hypothetical protein